MDILKSILEAILSAIGGSEASDTSPDICTYVATQGRDSEGVCLVIERYSLLCVQGSTNEFLGQVSTALFAANRINTVKSQNVPRQQRTFKASKRLAERDNTITDMLNSAGHEDVSFCVCDHERPDCPIIFASDGFCTLTGYGHTEIEGRNCR